MHLDPRPYAWIALGTIAAIGLFEGAKGVILPHMLSDLQLSPAAWQGGMHATRRVVLPD